MFHLLYESAPVGLLLVTAVVGLFGAVVFAFVNQSWILSLTFLSAVACAALAAVSSVAV